MEGHILFILGWSASALVIISLFMKSMMRMRWISLVGGIIYAAYGLIFGSMPLFCYNILRAFVNVYFLRNLYKNKDLLELLHVPADDPYLKYIMSAYKKDIQKFIPSFSGELRSDAYCVFALRNAEVAGLVITHPGEPGEIVVSVDYAVPKYRDLKSAKFLMEKYAHAIERMSSHGFKYLSTVGETPWHIKYLLEIGYVSSGVNNQYCMTLESFNARYMKNVH